MVEPATAVLALIPARGGSKGLPRKNLRLLGGLPLVAHSIRAALAAQSVSRVIVSTDDEEIATVARQHGAETPFLRPAELAADDTADLPVFVHALDWLDRQEGYRPDVVVHLRPTTPLAAPDDIDRGVELLRSHPDADAVRMVTSPLQNPYKMWRVGPDGLLVPLLACGLPEPYNQPRQKLPPVLWQNGLDIIRRRTILEFGSMTGRRILPLIPGRAGWRSWIDIDSELTLQVAETLLAHEARPGRRALPADARLLVLDFDGVLTDNRAWVDGDGREWLAVNRSDGLGLALLRERGIEVFVLSSEASPAVEARCRKLGLPCATGVRDKLPVFTRLLAERGLPARQVVFAGNDVNDLGCMAQAGCGVAVADAHPEVLRQADVVLRLPGGRGAVRELCDLLLQARNL